MRPYPDAQSPENRRGSAATIDPYDRPLDDLRFEVLRHIRRGLTAADQVDCVVERDGPRIVVHLHGPSIGHWRRRALAVLVLDAVRSAGHTYGQVDVTYGSQPDD